MWQGRPPKNNSQQPDSDVCELTTPLLRGVRVMTLITALTVLARIGIILLLLLIIISLFTRGRM
jgi:hypothetical protein